MIATITLPRLLEAADRVGVCLTRVQEHGDLYAWVTPAEEVVYVGRSVSARRLRDERGWTRSDPRAEVLSGIVTLLRVNEACPVPLVYEQGKFAPSRSLSAAEREQWQGAAFVELRSIVAARPPTVAEVEELLVRIAVRYGTPLGNAQFHSQWEAPIGRLADTLAALAVDTDRTFTVPPPPCCEREASDVEPHQT